MEKKDKHQRTNKEEEEEEEGRGGWVGGWRNCLTKWQKGSKPKKDSNDLKYREIKGDRLKCVKTSVQI